jgi:NAD(P)-dependent dehydrogenase (short-subunit alcohol dehydrogenase family)
MNAQQNMLLDKAVVVSGASTGIGKAIALACLEQGAHVVAHHIGTEASLGDAQVLSDRGAKLVDGDIRFSETADAIVKCAMEAYGRIDVVVANAGIWYGSLSRIVD